MPDNKRIDLEQSLKLVQSSIAASKSKLGNLQQSYNQASGQGLTKQAQEIANEIEIINGNLGLLDQQKKDVESQILQISQLAEPRKNPQHHNNFNPKASKDEKNKAEADAKAKADGDTTKDQVPPPTVVPTNTNNPQVKPKATTPKQIKRQLKANLAAGQPKKNLRLIRQQGSQKAKIPVTSPLTQIIQTSSTPSTSEAQTPSTSPITSTPPIIAAAAVAAAPIKALSTGKKIIQMARNIVKTIKALGTVIKGAAGPVGLAIAAAQLLAPLIKKIKKVLYILGGLLALHFFMQLMHLIGLIVGLAFGAISGLPLLLIPGVGPFLYAGWVGFWGYRGLTNPFGTIQLATHPWELITRPLTWVGQRFSDLGAYFKGGTEYVGSGVSNAASTAFYGAANFVTGLAQSLWGGITSAIGNTASWLGGVAGNAFGMASGLASSVSSLATVGVGGTVAALSVGGILVAGTNMVALSTTEGDISDGYIAPGTNELFTITKTVDKSQIPTPDIFTPTPVTFTVTIKVSTNNLSSLQFSDATSAANGSTFTTGTDTCQQSLLPPTLAAGATWTCTLVVNANASHKDTTITNTATFTATAPDITKTVTDTASATFRVGDVPAGCPSGWPTSGPITQGPDGATSHAAGAMTAEGYEAIDIGKGAVYGDPIYATFTGTVVDVWSKADNVAFDKRVHIAPLNCPGLDYVAFWHNRDILVTNGQVVNKGDTIARSGAYKSTDGTMAPHLHYQFNSTPARSFRIEEPYVPDDSYGRTCNNGSGCGVTATAP